MANQLIWYNAFAVFFFYFHDKCLLSQLLKTTIQSHFSFKFSSLNDMEKKVFVTDTLHYLTLNERKERKRKFEKMLKSLLLVFVEK